ncbi:hypothetical protein A11A3_10306 [Alcanivorax hongdengensis A-11-3]|uniref:DUF2393 domain-containing protein n=1 Tax=Alcanivorax hongdengensis A-11-3 TaxID=1177179 RepID=L0WBA2_9GAMM|nr:hypothetical protein [Alcanivorax hongdengensis]EKF74043.1 hypothetical protein A11A3_10306 [Alcanivorax hongdengensis A-11-3]
MRLLLVLTVVIAVAVLLWGSWQWGRKVFFAVLAAVVAGAIAIGLGAWYAERTSQVSMPAEDIVITLDDHHRTESGVILSGSVRNDGKLAVASLTLEAAALRCAQADQCTTVFQQRIPLEVYLPVGSEYPFEVVSRPTAAAKEANKWQVRAVTKMAYPQ